MNKEKEEKSTTSLILNIIIIVSIMIILSEVYMVYVSKTNNNFLNINSLNKAENVVENTTLSSPSNTLINE
jgi:hypothetical protein